MSILLIIVLFLAIVVGLYLTYSLTETSVDVIKDIAESFKD